MGIRHHSTARHSTRPSAYVLRNARLKRVKKRVRDFFGTVNRKGHEHITLMIASHSANTPVFTLRISKYIILFIAGVLAVTITFSVSAFIEKGTTDPEIERLERNIERCEETLELFSRNVRTLESSTAKFSDAIKPLAAITESGPSSGCPSLRGRRPLPVKSTWRIPQATDLARISGVSTRSISIFSGHHNSLRG